MSKTVDDSFRDWEANAFGFGYGTGEEHTLAALKAFMAAIPERQYDYKVLETALGGAVAWLLINTLCAHKVQILEYGTSPRYAWLTDEGQRLKAYLDSKTVEELCEVVCGADPEDYTGCYPDACNCGPNGYQAGVHCHNPFWASPR